MEDLKVTLETYRMQLKQIEAAISGGQRDEELYLLQDEMKQLISLTEESLLSYEKSILLSMVNVSTPKIEEDIASSSTNSLHSCQQSDTTAVDDQMASFYAEIASTENEARNTLETTTNKSEATTEISTFSTNGADDNKTISSYSIEERPEKDTKLNEEFLKLIENCSDIAGTKCQAPHKTEWSGSQYHNAMIMSLASDSESDTAEASEESIFVKVLFLNPTLEEMKPCPYFLDGSCKFSVSDCKFSHGHTVSLYDLRKFKEPDFSDFVVDSPCIAKHSNGVWHPATVLEVLDDHQYVVQFPHQNINATLPIDDIFPIPQTDESSSDSDETDSDDDDVVLVIDDSTSGDKSSTHSSSLASWERHTTGFGSKMLQKYGYEMGEGLGKDKSGRVEPVPVVVLPAGKSLDHCMRLREKKEGLADGSSASTLPRKRHHRHTVFHFLNKTLGAQKQNENHLRKLLPKDSFGIKKEKSKSGPCKIQVELVKNDTKIKQLKEKINKYKESIARNKDRAPNVVKQQRAKLLEAMSELQAVQSSSKAIELHQHRADTHRKMTRF